MRFRQGKDRNERVDECQRPIKIFHACVIEDCSVEDAETQTRLTP